ncbi:copper amine oxidase N-terminal domain-containing protein [Paenibacillus daejeonensis]|uniref:copper amine oxidase N-terminal domain-containing protein n=1 Tax=Paenibacillus daejeonensis TaxID=135193 RepID=UPI000371D168|nr:copper amine oxidase N-terminal domain-containing protein [Paenibacillus daejeonensis]
MKFKQFGRKAWTALMLSAVLVIVAGCQALGGLDLNGMLKQAMKVTSMEGKESFEVQLLFRDDLGVGLGAEDMAMLALLSNIKLELNDIRMKDAENMSLKGNLALGDKDMDFKVVAEEERVRIELEGAKRAFYLDLADLGLQEWEDAEAYELDEEAEASLIERGNELLDYIGNYAIDNLPNPSKLSVAPAQTEVNGETLQTMRVQAEIGGDEVLPLVHAYLDALIADEEGLTELVTAVITLFSEETDIWEAAGVPDPFESSLTEQSQEEFIQEGVTEILGLLGELQTELRTAQAEEPESFDVLLNENSYFKTEIYVDSKLDIRKKSSEIVFKPSFPEDDEYWYDFPLEGFVIRTSGEQWNVNGEVTPERLVTARTDLSLDKLFEMESYELVRLFDEDTLMNDLLRQMGFALQTVELYPEFDPNPPILTPDGITLIPLRDTTEALGAQLAYLADTNTYDVYDPATGTYLKFRKGSNRVTVNDVDTNWSYPATIIGGTMYVPARNYIEALGGTLYWDTFYFAEDEKYLVLEREL